MVTSRLELRILDQGNDFVEVYVDGELLAERLMAIERSAQVGYVYTDRGLNWHEVDYHTPTAFDGCCLAPGNHGDRLLFMCGNCVVGCGDTNAHMITTPETMTLSCFSRPVRSLLMPALVFDREQFAAEVNRINRWYADAFPASVQQKRERLAWENGSHRST